MKISEMVDEGHKNARNKGFWEDIELLVRQTVAHEVEKEDRESRMSNAIAMRIALIHSEVSEALEALRLDGMERLGEELADIVLRVADLAGGLNIDLEKEIKIKMEKNKSREYKHGKRF